MVRTAAYIAIFLHFLRKCLRKVNVIPASPGESGREYFVIVPLYEQLVVVGGFYSQHDAERMKNALYEGLHEGQPRFLSGIRSRGEIMSDGALNGKLVSVFEPGVRGRPSSIAALRDLSRKYNQNSSTCIP